MQTSKEIRESFKLFFAKKGHHIVPSAPMVIKDDPTLMFTNAGMNQFKDIILGNAPIKYPKVADSQKCLRVSGKHNDLEEVGLDTYHHTMFEMLGNWSFGDYFKKEAIEWAWEYLVEVLKLDPNRLYATVFEGYAPEGLERDNEAAGYWEKYLPKDRIINGNRKDNFWEMGDTGPCGPCSEVHIDLRSDEDRAAINGLTLVNESHPQVIEIWNLVFMQYNRKTDSSLESLPAKVIDTGMGFERLCMAVQGKISNYDTDVFQPIIKAVAKLANKTYGENLQSDIAMRVISDHIRTISFAITDGQLPSNAKAGYVIRRILRRAVRYGYTFLGQQQSFMHKLLPALINTMGDAYPELIAQQELISKVIKEEEESFLRTLETGIKLLDKVMEETRKNGKTQICGKDAFQLYDTYGFPLDLTELILKENNLTLNTKEFTVLMQEQKERARNAAATETGDWIVLLDGDPKFIGYDFDQCDTRILRYRKIKQKSQELYQIVLDKTPFYAEGGGQVGDRGTLTNEKGQIIIIDTKKENNLPIHLAKILPQKLDGFFHAQINSEARQATAANHTATHLLHEALRQVLGTHIEQKGSMVTPEGLRFDFSHYQKVSDQEIRQVERLLNEKIRQNVPLQEHRNVAIDQARQMGAMALFGEKYGDEVRVIQYGSSVELCAGTHAQSSGQIGMFKIVSESSTAAGIRRIEAVTGRAIEELIYLQEDLVAQMKEILNTPNLIQAITKAINENADMRKQMEDVRKERVLSLKQALLNRKQNINGIQLIEIYGSMPADIAKDVAFQLRNEESDLLIVAGTHDGDKPLLTIALSDNLVEQGMNASNMVRAAAKEIQGGGGGQPHFAQAGGKKIDGLRAAIEQVVTSIS